MRTDKQRAKQNKWRISERMIWTISILGGSLGALTGMYGYRHKTKHLSFKLGLPLLLICQIVIGLCWYFGFSIISDFFS
ncbi:Uncharacterized membrane protein YsdA, DUF1294 family [Amphibacillus marinus]|uniref:Uncharacterized membrane protein YsdA, DUF1294 family n=2 Tax=Amphibacillus marinus TaxID=872970 RepID=A0A1H8SSY4_9BACI|nr:Uncharacterized membrane protein YsdA, DUF1294 family [Amphibacillus marinus]